MLKTFRLFETKTDKKIVLYKKYRHKSIISVKKFFVKILDKPKICSYNGIVNEHLFVRLQFN